MKKLMIAAALCTGLLGAQAAPLFTVQQQPVTQQAPAKKEVKGTQKNMAKAAPAERKHAATHHANAKAQKEKASMNTRKEERKENKVAAAPAHGPNTVKKAPTTTPTEKR